MLTKAIKHGKEHRRDLYHKGRVCQSCGGGTCDYCLRGITSRAKFKAKCAERDIAEEVRFERPADAPNMLDIAEQDRMELEYERAYQEYCDAIVAWVKYELEFEAPAWADLDSADRCYFQSHLVPDLTEEDT